MKEGYLYRDVPIEWGDVHHPKHSLTNGEYDGKWLAVADKAAGRLAIIDLRDFRTKQIVKTPNTVSDHGKKAEALVKAGQAVRGDRRSPAAQAHVPHISTWISSNFATA